MKFLGAHNWSDMFIDESGSEAAAGNSAASTSTSSVTLCTDEKGFSDSGVLNLTYVDAFTICNVYSFQ